MKILDVLSSPWSICPAKMAEIRNIYHAHFGGPKIDWKEMEARVGISLKDQPDEQYQNMNGVAVVPVKGVLTKGLSFFSFLFGGSSMKQIGMAFQAALDDQDVKSILLDIDSPGGTVDGTEELAKQIFQARGQKPILAYSDGEMLSAAYWIASAADELFISGDTVLIGSISVLGTHVDQSKQDDMNGLKFTEITSGKYKRIAGIHKPLSDEGKAYLQDQVDYINASFIQNISRNRAMSEETVAELADGKIFIGNQAVEAGLVDGVEAFSDLINKLSTKEESIVNLQELKEKHPDVYAAAVAEGKTAGVAEGVTSGKAAGIDEGKALGAAAERQRIADVRAQLIPGHEALIDSLIADGKTTGPEAAVKVLAAEKVIREGKAAAFARDGQLGVASPAPPPPPAKPAIDPNLPIDQKAKAEWDADPKLRAEFGEENFANYLAYRKNEGRIKILGKKS